MITKERAKELYISKKLCPAQSEFIIDELFDSIGSCAECEYYQGEEVIIFNCSENDLWVREDFFCADFKRKELEANQKDRS